MALETEIKLSLPASAARRLPAHGLLADSKPLRQKLVNTYYDTPDRRLQRKRVAVRYRQKGTEWLLTVKSDAPSPGGLAQRSEWEAPGQPGDFDFAHVDNPKLRRFLESVTPELVPLFTTDFTRNFWVVVPQAGTRIEVALDRGKIVAGERQEPICEVELELLEGKVAALFTAALSLQSDLPLHPEGASKAERGYRLASAEALVPNKATDVRLEMGMTSIAVFRSTAFSCLSQLQGNERGLRESNAPEFIHQARVAMRRLRSAIRLWRPLLPEEYVNNFDPRWRTLANQLGDTRNWTSHYRDPASDQQGVPGSQRPAAPGRSGHEPPGGVPQGSARGYDLAHLLAIVARVHRRHGRSGGKQEATADCIRTAFPEQARQARRRVGVGDQGFRPGSPTRAARGPEAAALRTRVLRTALPGTPPAALSPKRCRLARSARPDERQCRRRAACRRGTTRPPQ
jgi:inorganic triphosphatase YgiF